MGDERPPKRKREDDDDESGDGNDGMDKSMGKPMSLLRMRNHSTIIKFKRRWIQEIGQWKPGGTSANSFCPNYNCYEFYTRKGQGIDTNMDMWEWFKESSFPYGNDKIKTFTNFVPLTAKFRVSNMIPLQTGLQVPQGVITTTFNNTPYLIIAEDSTGTHQVVNNPGTVSDILKKSSLRLADEGFYLDPVETFASATMFREGDIYEKYTDFRGGLGPLKYVNEFDDTHLTYLPNQYPESSCYQPFDKLNTNPATNFSYNNQGYGQQNFILMTMPYIKSVADDETAIELKCAVTFETELVIEAYYMGANQQQNLDNKSTQNQRMQMDGSTWNNLTIQRANGLNLQKENTTTSKQYKFANWAY